MLLKPRKFKHKNIFKRRVLTTPKFTQAIFQFGTQSLSTSANLSLTAQKMFRMKLLVKKSCRRSDKTARKLWFNAFPHLPLTKKVIGSRMGKGKGKLNSWFTIVKAGNVLFEVKNLRRGRFAYFATQLKSRLGCHCVCLQRYNTFKTTRYFYNKSKTLVNFSHFL